MKIKIITCHNVYNYGASLQAFALQYYLRMKGNEVEIIDYLPDYKKVYKLIVPKRGKTANLIKILPILKPVLVLMHNRHKLRLFLKKKYFDRFTRDYLCTTKIKYDNFEQLESFPPEADLFIAGSDQIWNPNHGNGQDKAFYLLFEKNMNKCISYAGSFGVSVLPNGLQSFMMESLMHFRALSVREKSGKIILDKLGISSTVVLDPVFLLRREIWLSFCQKTSNSNKYLLLYDFQLNDPEVKKIALKISKSRGLKIYAIYSTPDYADKILKNVGPIEFLSLIANADFVVSTSFHATAFSVIFEKEFYCLAQKGEGNESRMRDFCESIGLLQRFVTGVEQISDTKIDYILINQKLDSLVRKSCDWLDYNCKLN